ncbi:MAG: Kazal-type serine protease inhibitor family protein [Nanoarchaeota archaeon]
MIKSWCLLAILIIALLLAACSPEETLLQTANLLPEEQPLEPAGETCPDDSAPVCGNDGKTYVNKCWAKKDKIEIAYEGECKQPIICRDSDKGINLMTRGTVLKENVIKTDICVSIYNVQEFFCENNEISSAVNTCPVGNRCINGACTEECTDSDNGKDLFNLGSTQKGSLSKADACSASSVIEYFCEDNNIRSLVSACTTGFSCDEGTCVPECTDSDGGVDYNIVGTTTKGSESKSDTCEGEKIVEYYCLDNELKSKTAECNPNWVCLSGACIRSATQ